MLPHLFSWPVARQRRLESNCHRPNDFDSSPWPKQHRPRNITRLMLLGNLHILACRGSWSLPSALTGAVRAWVHGETTGLSTLSMLSTLTLHSLFALANLHPYARRLIGKLRRRNHVQIRPNCKMLHMRCRDFSPTTSARTGGWGGTSFSSNKPERRFWAPLRGRHLHGGCIPDSVPVHLAQTLGPRRQPSTILTGVREERRRCPSFLSLWPLSRT